MIALYPGAFKPPHRGHFEVVKRLLNGNHGGKVYDIDSYAEAGTSVLQGTGDQLDKIEKVLVFIGGGSRNGITKEESIAVWNIYAKYLPGLVVMDGEKNPMFAAKDYAKANETDKFYAITGIRAEEDLPDLKRVTTFKNRENVQGLVIPAGTNSNVRATDFRNAILSGNLDEVLDFFPEALSRDEILKIMNMLKASIIAEIMQEDLEKKLNEMFNVEDKIECENCDWSWDISSGGDDLYMCHKCGHNNEPANRALEEGSSGTAIAPQGVMKSADRVKLVTLYNRLRNVIGDEYYDINYNHDHIIIKNKDEGQRIGFDYTPFMGSILEYMIDEGMSITPLPEVKIKKDIAESSNFFGKTAYYDPTKKEVVLYVQGRHPKDVMRSFAHEMIHHKQNLEGRLGGVGTTNTNEDSNLLELEKEAYLEGNITFRNWEDNIKN
jgi:nicotinamide mononucleotide adenylyltransferase